MIFNASLMYGMRAIGFLQRLVDGGTLTPPRDQRLFIHRIEDEGRMRCLGFSSKYNNEPTFLHELRENGKAAAGAWRQENRAAPGQRDGVDLRARFL